MKKPPGVLSLEEAKRLGATKGNIIYKCRYDSEIIKVVTTGKILRDYTIPNPIIGTTPPQHSIYLYIWYANPPPGYLFDNYFHAMAFHLNREIYKKELKMLSKPQITSERKLVSPQDATTWLERNTHNRAISQVKVEQYAADMKAKKWELNGEPIIFDWDNVLQDGQHRLWACVESHTSFETMIVYGVDPATFKTIDTGKARSGSDVLGIQGYTNTNVLAAAARLVMEYKSRAALTNMTHSRLSNADVLAFVDKNKELHKWVVLCRGHALTKKFGSLLAAVAYIGSHRYEAKAQEFIEQFGRGENLTVGSPVLSLRNRLLADQRLRREERFGLIVLTWNAFVTGRSLLKTQLPRGSECPKIAGAEK